jgi:hypothetical protein
MVFLLFHVYLTGVYQQRRTHKIRIRIRVRVKVRFIFFSKKKTYFEINFKKLFKERKKKILIIKKKKKFVLK